MRRRWAMRAGGSVAAAALSLGGSWLWVSTPATAAPTTQQFEFTSAAQVFVVPADVCLITVDAFGAQGGNGGVPPGVGGLGGRATATLAVTPGEILQVTVGGRGGANAGDVGGAGGFPDGGDGGSKASGGGVGGAGGGGSSDVRRGGTRLVVAGGGGGGAHGVDDTLGTNADAPNDGGGGGGATGADGEFGDVGGKGGTQSAAGAGGTGNVGNGDPGTGSVGGDGAGDVSHGGVSAGGGGGGGFFGGGGGGRQQTSPVGFGGGGGGGGGSGFGPAGVAFETGVRTGAGVVTISFDPDAGGCPQPVVAEPRFTG